MKIKDIKWLINFTRFKRNAIIRINEKDYSVQLQQDQDGNWIINFTETNEASKDSKNSQY